MLPGYACKITWNKSEARKQGNFVIPALAMTDEIVSVASLLVGVAKHHRQSAGGLTAGAFKFTLLKRNDSGVAESGRINMTTTLYLATAIGVYAATQIGGAWHTDRLLLANPAVTAITVCDGVLVAGTREGIRRSTDGGATWGASETAPATRHVRWLAAAPQPAGRVFAGTEPAGIHLSEDHGKTWQSDTQVPRLRDKHGWYLPYSSGAGCVRGFAFARSGPRPERVYAAVEVGGVLISDDGGRSWSLAAGSDGNPEIDRDLGSRIHPDVHSIDVHPGSSDLVTAATGGGLYRSSDGGKSWNRVYRCYIRAVWVDPSDADHLIAGPADGVSRNGRIEESRDGGQSWQPASEGMETPWRHHMVERFVQVDDQLLAVLSNGELWMRVLGAENWQQILSEVADIKAVAAGN